MGGPEDQVTPEAEPQTEPQGQPDGIEVNGEIIPLDELKAGYMKDADYRRKTQEAAAERQRLQIYAELDAHLAEHPEKKEQLIALLSDEEPEAPDTGGDSEDEGEDEMSENKRLRDEVDAIKQQLTDQKRLVELNELLSAALEEHPGADRNRVLGMVSLPQNTGKTFKDLAKEDEEGQKALKQKIRDEYIAELESQEPPGIGRGISAMGKKPEAPKNRPGSKAWAREMLDEADKGFLEDLRKQEE